MAVCRQDKAYKDYTSNPTHTPFAWMTPFFRLCSEINVKQHCVQQKMKQVWCSFCMPCLVCTQPSPHRISVVFGTATTFYKYQKHFPKMYRDVGMAVPKTTQTRYMDCSVQATQMTTQVNPSQHNFSFLLSAQSCFQYSDNKARYTFY